VVKGRWWTGRYYEDVPGQISRRRKSIPIGLKEQMTKPEARRKLRAMLEEMGVNTVAHLERSLHPVQMFSEYADWWEKNIQPTHQPSSANSSHYILKKHLRPRFGDMPLDSITQESVQEWIADLQREGKLKPRSISQTNPWQEASEGLDSPFTQEPEKGAAMVYRARNGANHRCGLGPVQMSIPTGSGYRDAFWRTFRVASGRSGSAKCYRSRPA
jgi:Phage integrase, N-terminal SAM-like domain